MPVFQSRAEAFDFMVTERISKGDDYAEAVERADKFADVIAKNKKLPLTPPRPKNGVEKIVGYIEQIATVKKEHPEVWELVAGGIGGLISGFALIGHKQSPPSIESETEKIDFNKIQ
jgi:hypothetical protein